MKPIDYQLPPTVQQFDLKLLNQTVSLKCQTNVSQSKLANSQYRDQPLIQNFYCYKLNHQLIKVTKVRIGSQLITMVDRLSMKNDKTQQQTKKRTGETSELRPFREFIGESYLSPRKNKLLKMYCGWVQKNQPQIKGILDQVLRCCFNQLELQTQMRQNIQMRSSLIAFKQALKQEKGDKTLYKVLKRWLKQSFQQEDIQKNNQQTK